MEQVVLAKGELIPLVFGGVLFLVAIAFIGAFFKFVSQIGWALIHKLWVIAEKVICWIFYNAGRLYGWMSRRKIF